MEAEKGHKSRESCEVVRVVNFVKVEELEGEELEGWLKSLQ